MADPRIEAFKQFALQQAAMQQPQMGTPQMQGGLPELGGPSLDVQQQPSPQTAAPPTAGNPGPIKSFLSQFLYGAGQGLLAKTGLETDAEKQQRMFNQQQMLQNSQALNALRQQQMEASAAQNQPVDLSTFGVPGLQGTVPQKDAARVIAQHVNSQGRIDTQQKKNEGAITVQGMKGDTAETIQGQKAQQQQTHDAYVGGVQRDIAAGKLGVAAARLNLAKQVAAAKADGTYGAPSADRLRRGDLANNAQVNLDNVINHIKADPSIFGQIAGHYSTVQQMMGSDNPNIKDIGIEIHNAALASNGAHGLRAQGAIEGTENVLLNHFRDSPEVAISGMKTMQDSLDTFIQDAQHGKTFVPRKGTTSTPSNSVGSGNDPFAKYGGRSR